MEPTELRAALEAILFVSNEPVRLDDLADAFSDEGRDAVVTQLEEIKQMLESSPGGFLLEQTAGGWRFATRAQYDPILKKYFSKKGENRLSLAALETLAIVAYRQPITAPEVSELRGVNSTAVIRTLLERRMVRVAGRKNVVGSPFLYRTTREFLIHFGLNDIRDLPRLEEFGDLIGESMNEDLVSAIANAPSGDSAVIVDEPATEAERAAAEEQALHELDNEPLRRAPRGGKQIEEGAVESSDGVEHDAGDSGDDTHAASSADDETRSDDNVVESSEDRNN